jgi:hypothetical protein
VGLKRNGMIFSSIIMVTDVIFDLFILAVGISAVRAEREEYAVGRT